MLGSFIRVPTSLLVLHGEAGGFDEVLIAVVAVGVLWVAVKLAGRKPIDEADETTTAEEEPIDEAKPPQDREEELPRP